MAPTKRVTPTKVPPAPVKRVTPIKLSMAPYLKKESALTHLNLDKAKTDMEETLKEFDAKCDHYKVDLSHFDEITKQYNLLMAEAFTGKQENDLHKMKKATASLEILEENVKKMTKEFKRRFKKLIADAPESDNEEDETSDGGKNGEKKPDE